MRCSNHVASRNQNSKDGPPAVHKGNFLANQGSSFMCRAADVNPCTESSRERMWSKLSHLYNTKNIPYKVNPNGNSAVIENG